MDRRLIEFCAYLPGHLRQRDGWPKRILRDLMLDRLPAGVLWSRGKRHVGWVFNVAVTRKAIESGNIDLQIYSVRSTLTQIRRAWRRPGDSDMTSTSWRSCTRPMCWAPGLTKMRPGLLYSRPMSLKVCPDAGNATDMTEKPDKAPVKAAHRNVYRTPRLRQFGQVGVLTQSGTNNGQEYYMMMQVVTMMRN